VPEDLDFGRAAVRRRLFLQDSDCDDNHGAGDSGSIGGAKLAGWLPPGRRKNGDQVNIRGFTGQSMHAASNGRILQLLRGPGWGYSAGLANCSSEEMAIGKAKAKK
jgi:conjugal transfer mating pair stabilization protein TraN